MSRELKFALVGAGFIGRSHALAIHAVNHVFADAALTARAFIVAESTEARARDAAQKLGFEAFTASWEEAVEKADAVIVAVPSNLHARVASRAIEAGKAVLCEKPVGLSSAEAAQLAASATAAGIVNAVGFTYCRAPLVQHAKAMLRGGALGPIMHVRGRHAEDYLADPHQPHSWRLSQAHAGRFGALGDLGYHIIAILRDLCGPLSALSGLSQTMHAQRRGEEDEAPRSVENEDYAAALLSFEGGAVGTVETSRIATGRKMELSFEIVCERGTLAFDAERMNELLLYEPEQPSQTQGFRTLLANATHPYYAGFLPAPGHQIGFNDLKTIEIYQFLEGVARGEPVPPDLNDAVCVSRICDAIVDSADTGARIQSPETYGGSEP